jgi:bifunctional DNA-binding transcriptional regulator/antitoxin component of YhaV-PrlF toxin-antitoxin module
MAVTDSVRRKAGLRTGDQLEFKVSGRVMRIVPKPPAGRSTPDVVMQIVEEVKKNPMPAKELAAAHSMLLAYGERQAKKAGINERDIVRVIHDSRSRH